MTKDERAQLIYDARRMMDTDGWQRLVRDTQKLIDGLKQSALYCQSYEKLVELRAKVEVLESLTNYDHFIDAIEQQPFDEEQEGTDAAAPI